jgi:hypothetical protein
MSSIFGGSKQKSQSTSNNQAYGAISDYAGGLLPYAQQGASGLSSLLGGNTAGLDAFKNAMGYDFTAEQGSRGVTGNAAAAGLLRSGSTQKGLARYATGLNNQFADTYMDQLMKLAGVGQNAANTLAGAGQQSSTTSSGKSKEGMAKTIGAAASFAAAGSDRRLKKDIKEIGITPEGLTLYTYYYKTNPFFKQTGVMADEVALKKPEALGPTINGYMTVDYSKLEI